MAAQEKKQKNVNENDADLLFDFAKVRYRKKMEKLTAEPGFIEIPKLEKHHEKLIYSTLEMISETRPLTNVQKQNIKTTLDEIFTLFQELNLKKKESQGPAIGIDLGTTFCCVAVVKNISQEAEIVENDLGNNKTPSYIAFPNIEDNSDDDDDDEDEKDYEPYFGETAKMMAHENPQGTFFDVKRMLGRKYRDPEIQKDMKLWPFHIINEGGEIRVKIPAGPRIGDLQSPVELTTLLIQHLKKLAENAIGASVMSAVVAVPAYFNSNQRQLTKEACKSAGLNVLQLVNEPTAAAVAYKIHKSSKGPEDSKSNCLIFDFGGGTFDVAVLTMSSNKIHVKAVGGDPHLGGEDIDNNMVNYCIQKFKEVHGVNLIEETFLQNSKVALKTSQRLRRLKLECETKKRYLSQCTDQVISLEAMYGSTPLVVPISRELFESINMELFQRCIKIVEEMLSKSEMKKEEIDEVVLVGGSSRIPRLQDMLSEFFGGKQLYRSIDADEAVAVGAARLAFQAEHVEIPNVLIQEEQDSGDAEYFSAARLSWTTHIQQGPRRVNHAAVIVGQTIYSIGGYLGGEDYSTFGPLDVHTMKTNVPNLQWELLVLRNQDKNSTPFRRYGHTAVCYGPHIFLWGGRNDQKECNVLFRFDTKSLKWEKPEVSGTTPCPRDGHTAVVIRNNMYIFGGYGDKKGCYLQDLYTLNLETLVWSTIIASGAIPSPRDFHTAVVLKERFIMVFGGRGIGNAGNSLWNDDELYCNILYCFDSHNNEWMTVSTNGMAPQGRRSHCAFVYNGFMYIFGGYNGVNNTFFNDICRYDPGTKTWQNIIPTGNGPVPMRRPACVLVENRAFFYGGTTPNLNGNSKNAAVDITEDLVDLNDTFVLEFSS